jgi:hypothetical protein
MDLALGKQHVFIIIFGLTNRVFHRDDLLLQNQLKVRYICFFLTP